MYYFCMISLCFFMILQTLSAGIHFQKNQGMIGFLSLIFAGVLIAVTGYCFNHLS